MKQLFLCFLQNCLLLTASAVSPIRAALYLSYLATFKVRTFESLLYKINTCLQKTTTCIGLRAEQIFSVNI